MSITAFERVTVTDNDGDTLTLTTRDACVVLVMEDKTAFAVVAFERNQLLQLKKAVDAAYKEIDK